MMDGFVFFCFFGACLRELSRQSADWAQGPETCELHAYTEKFWCGSLASTLHTWPDWIIYTRSQCAAVYKLPL